MNFDLRLGDCLELMTDIADQSVDMILADLPYGTTACRWDSVIPLDRLWEQYRRIIKPAGAVVLTAQQPFSTVLGASNLKWLRYEWVWEKTNATGHLNAKNAPMKAHEQVLVFYDRKPTYNPQMTQGKPLPARADHGSKNWDAGAYGKIMRCRKANPMGQRYPRSVLTFPGERGLHPTQKPVALMEYLIRTYTDEGQTVLDNTMGSGTTGVAAMQSARHFIGMERDPDYMQVALDRISVAQDKSAMQ
jgi:DNA modification methylase